MWLKMLIQHMVLVSNQTAPFRESHTRHDTFDAMLAALGLIISCHRALDRAAEIIDLERLVQKSRAVMEAWGRPIIPGDEPKWDSSSRQGIGDLARENPIQPEVDDRRVQGGHFSKVPCRPTVIIAAPRFWIFVASTGSITSSAWRRPRHCDATVQELAPPKPVRAPRAPREAGASSVRDARASAVAAR
jgi:hypothetical protein